MERLVTIPTSAYCLTRSFSATKGDPDAMKIVLQYYQSYIAHLSMRKIRDESGNTYWGIDEDLRERLQSKLMQAVLNFKAD